MVTRSLMRTWLPGYWEPNGDGDGDGCVAFLLSAYRVVMHTITILQSVLSCPLVYQSVELCYRGVVSNLACVSSATAK